ncbi:hypothetical protein CR51_23585 [Caballeronia megalochromosomata]|nr:hypothetical protein CR51_23585 [Caballeronia megalochromosomata]
MVNHRGFDAPSTIMANRGFVNAMLGEIGFIPAIDTDGVVRATNRHEGVDTFAHHDPVAANSIGIVAKP